MTTTTFEDDLQNPEREIHKGSMDDGERKRGYLFFATCNFEKLSFSIQLFGASFASFKRNYKYILKILSLCCHVLDKM